MTQPRRTRRRAELLHRTRGTPRAAGGTPDPVTWADKDPIFTDKYRRRLERTFPNASTVVIAGAGHFVQSDAPHEFCHAIDAWWDKGGHND